MYYGISTSIEIAHYVFADAHGMHSGVKNCQNYILGSSKIEAP